MLIHHSPYNFIEYSKCNVLLFTDSCMLHYYSSSIYNVYILSGFNWKIGLWAQWWLPGDCDGPVCPTSPLWRLVYQRGHLCKFLKASLLKGKLIQSICLQIYMHGVTHNLFYFFKTDRVLAQMSLSWLKSLEPERQSRYKKSEQCMAMVCLSLPEILPYL